MTKLKKWEDIIKEERKHTNFRDFIRDFASWETLNLYRQDGKICRYPPERITKYTDERGFHLENYFRDYDLSKSFFDNFYSFFLDAPHSRLIDFGGNENSLFADAIFGVKNTYLSFVCGVGSSDIFYSMFVYTDCHRVFNSFMVTENCNEIYYSSGIANSSKIFYSRNVTDSNNCWFSTNLIGCEECIVCDNLQNQKYNVANKIYSKEDYFRLKQEILSRKDRFNFFLSQMKSNELINFASENVSGIAVIKGNNVENGFFVKNMANSRNVACGNGVPLSTNFFDSVDVGIGGEDFYGVVGAGGKASNLFFCQQGGGKSSNLYYCYMLQDSHHCFGCMYLQNKSYCILNKQYEENEWYEMVDKIFASMEKDGTIGKFLPPSFNPFYFNDTLATLIDPSFTKEEVTKLGYLWRDSSIKVDIPEGAEIVNIENLDIINYGEEILKKVIKDKSGNYYRIVKMEYDFLKKHDLPLPEIHWLDRIKLGF